MSSGPADYRSEAERIRHGYESSHSWRLTRPLRSLGRAARELRGGAAEDPASAVAAAPQPLGSGKYDSWLEAFCGEQLAQIDATCAGAGPEALKLFRALTPDLWALLLTQEYDVYPNIKSLLPDVPDSALQVMWTGTSGTELAAQSLTFLGRLSERFKQHSDRPLAEAQVLDFGCGWGRLTRFLARDVEPGKLFGCDPTEVILDQCRSDRVPAVLARSDLLPERLPFDGPFDLAFAFSVFTHLSEAAHEAVLRALHRALAPGAILVVTIRPPEYLRSCEALQPALRSLGPDPFARVAEPLYLFAGFTDDPWKFWEQDNTITYGETMLTLAYVRQRWADRFELLDVDLLVNDVHQVMLTLRRK